MAEDITKVLEQIGYSYFKVEEPISIENTIIQILLGTERRFLKAIPFIIYLTTKNPLLRFDLQKLAQEANKRKIHTNLNAILSVTANIFNKVEPQNVLFPNLQKYLPKRLQPHFVFSFDEYLYDFIAQKKLYEAEQKIGLAEKIHST